MTRYSKVIPEYTLVVGVDGRYLPRLRSAWSSWSKYKPSLLTHPMIVFRDKGQVTEKEIRGIVDHPDLSVCKWPPEGIGYEGSDRTAQKTARQRYDAMWTDAQRYKMLAGYVYIPAMYVKTPYWLKLDTVTEATGQDDWIDPDWFLDSPVIIAHRWGFTKPPDQMLRLDEWVERNPVMLQALADRPPLRLAPPPYEERLSHKRITSWCAFFDTRFTREASRSASNTCGIGQLPVPSQDGFLWYCAARLNLRIKQVNMKSGGWEHKPIREFSMEDVQGQSRRQEQ